MRQHGPRSWAGRLALGFLALGLVWLVAPSLASASTAANTVITNTATVSYNDSGGNAQTAVQASASITVLLVPSAVTLSSPGVQTIEQGTSATLSYTITGTANGADSYALTSADTRTNVAGGSLTVTTPIVLGGTTLAADATNGQTTITTPYDGTNDSVVNAIAVGDTIVIGSNAYTVTAVVENAGTNTADITIGTAISGGTVATGQVVGERQTFSASQSSGTVTSGSSGTHSVTLTATAATSPNPATSQGTATVITVNKPTLTVTKEVSVDNGATYAATGKTAPPGTSLIYKIVVTNGGAGVATTVTITDVLPAYITYVAGSGKYSTDAGTADYGVTTTDLTDGSGGYSYTGGTRTVAWNPGSPGLGTIAGGGGELVLFFRATVN